MKKKEYKKPTLNIVPIRACLLQGTSPVGGGESRRLDDWDN
jgi:hypothetical protein